MSMTWLSLRGTNRRGPLQATSRSPSSSNRRDAGTAWRSASSSQLVELPHRLGMGLDAELVLECVDAEVELAGDELVLVLFGVTLHQEAVSRFPTRITGHRLLERRLCCFYVAGGQMQCSEPLQHEEIALLEQALLCEEPFAARVVLEEPATVERRRAHVGVSGRGRMSLALGCGGRRPLLEEAVSIDPPSDCAAERVSALAVLYEGASTVSAWKRGA